MGSDVRAHREKGRKKSSWSVGRWKRVQTKLRNIADIRSIQAKQITKHPKRRSIHRDHRKTVLV